jgi:hypothetical protein
MEIFTNPTSSDISKPFKARWIDFGTRESNRHIDVHI